MENLLIFVNNNNVKIAFKAYNNSFKVINKSSVCFNSYDVYKITCKPQYIEKTS